MPPEYAAYENMRQQYNSIGSTGNLLSIFLDFRNLILIISKNNFIPRYFDHTWMK